MTLNCVKLGRAVTFMKYLASVVSLIFLVKSLIWNKITFTASNLLNFAELVENELMKNVAIRCNGFVVMASLQRHRYNGFVAMIFTSLVRLSLQTKLANKTNIFLDKKLHRKISNLCRGLLSQWEGSISCSNFFIMATVQWCIMFNVKLIHVWHFKFKTVWETPCTFFF